MAKSVGTLIKEARTEAGLTQDQLARAVVGANASDISKAERGELLLTQEMLKAIARKTGVTPTSLIEASRRAPKSTPKIGEKAKTSSTAKTTSTSKKTTTSGRSATAKKTMTVTTAERNLVELYRKADSNTKKFVMEILKDGAPTSQSGGQVGIPGLSPQNGELLGMLIGQVIEALGPQD